MTGIKTMTKQNQLILFKIENSTGPVITFVAINSNLKLEAYLFERAG